jgi:hypothetical protein
MSDDAFITDLKKEEPKPTVALPPGRYLRVEDAPLPTNFEMHYQQVPKVVNIVKIIDNIASTQQFNT